MAGNFTVKQPLTQVFGRIKQNCKTRLLHSSSESLYSWWDMCCIWSWAFLFNSCLEHYRYKKISTIYLQEMKINDESINAIHLENYCFKGFWLCVRFACKKDTFLIIFLDEFQFLKCWGTWTKPGFTMNSLQSLINVVMIHKLRESVGRVSINIQFLKCRG